MNALIATIARAELRRRVVGLVALVYGVVGTLVGVASHRTGSYPVLTDAVANLEYLGGLLMAAGALIAVRPIEFGVARELLLCGIGWRRRSIATAIVAIGCALTIWALGNVLTALALRALFAGRHAPTTLTAGSQSALLVVAAGVALVSCAALLGCAIGGRCRTRATAVAIVGALAVAPLVLLLFGSFPPALWLRALCPTALGNGLIEAYAGVRGTPLVRFGAPLLYLVVALCLVLTSHAPGVRRARRAANDDPGARPRAPGRAWASLLVPAAMLAVAATAFGYVAPQRTARAIPWWLRGDWLADQARKTTSAPVARAYVVAILHGDGRALGRLGAPDAEPPDPVLAAAVRRAASIRDVRFVYDDHVPAGTVVVTLGAAREEVDVTVCSVRTSAGWRVERLSSAGLC